MRVIIAEKLNQAGDYQEALGGGKRANGYYETQEAYVTWVWGHARRLKEPRDNDPPPAWTDRTAWPVIEPPVYLDSDDKKNREQIKVIEMLLKRREVTELVMATDPDREGDLIWYELHIHLAEKGLLRGKKLLRFSCGDPNIAPIREAFKRLLPLEGFMPRALSGMARSVNDMRWGTSLTVCATVDMRPAELREGVWKTGRVKAPAIYILEKREQERESFRKTTFYTLLVEVKTPIGTITLSYAPQEEHRILDKAVAVDLAARLRGLPGRLSVTAQERKVAPPKLPTKTKLLVAAAKATGMSASRIEQAAQANYEKHKVQTYLRASCPYISSADVENLAEIVAHLERYPELTDAARMVAREPVVRRGTVVNDREVAAASHTAIIPTKTPWDRPADRVALSEDEDAVYLFVAKRYLSVFMPDGIDRRTVVRMETGLQDRGRPVVLQTSGTVLVKPGWRSLWGRNVEVEDDDEGQANDAGTLPPVSDGMDATIAGAQLCTGETKIPPRYTFLGWQNAMQEVWRLVDDPAQRKRLQACKGIGTESSRKSLADELIKSGMVETAGRGNDPEVFPSPFGRLFCAGMFARYPDILSPSRTAMAEQELDQIAASRDERSARVAMDHYLEREALLLKKAVDAVRNGGPLPLPTGFQMPSTANAGGRAGPTGGAGSRNGRRPGSSTKSGGAPEKPSGSSRRQQRGSTGSPPAYGRGRTSRASRLEN